MMRCPQLAMWMVAAAISLAPLGVSAAPRLVGLSAEGADFRATLSDGRVLKGSDLVGATLNVGAAGTMMALRIDTAERDTHAEAPDVWLFSMTIVAPGAPDRSFCSPDPDGRQLAIPYPSSDTPGGFTLTCSSGAVGKCIRFGYRPWATAPNGAALAPLHAACVRMVRADYGGDSRPWTRNGMKIDLYDDLGIQRADPADTMPFEAGWTSGGAVCVAHPRVPENGSLADIARAAPRLGHSVGPDACTEAQARVLGAVIFNRSRATPSPVSLQANGGAQ